MGTTFTYNGHVFSDVMTNGIETSVTLDDTGAEPQSIKVNISMVVIAHKWDFSGQGDPVDLGIYAGVGYPDETMDGLHDILKDLNTPRRELKYEIGSTTLYHIKPFDSDDAASRYTPITGLRPALGATPKVSARVLKVINQNAVWIAIEAEFEFLPCSRTTAAGTNNIITFRWKTDDDIDTKTWLTRRMITGKITCKSRAYSPHLLRYVAFPPIDPGWKVSSIRFNEGDDNRSLSFAIGYEQIIEAPPKPAVDWEGDVVIAAPMGGIGVKTIDFSLSLTGHPDASKYELALLMLAIFDAKIGWYDLTTAGSSFCRMLVIRETIGQNRVSGQLTLDVLETISAGQDPETASAENYHNLLERILLNDMRDPFVGVDTAAIAKWWKRNAIRDANGNLTYRQPYGNYLSGYHPAISSYWLPMAHVLYGIMVPQVSGWCSTPTDAVSLKTRAWTGQDIPVAPDASLVSIPPAPVPPDLPPAITTGPFDGDSYSSSGQVGGDQMITSSQEDEVAPYLVYDMWTYYTEDTGYRSFPVSHVRHSNSRDKSSIMKLYSKTAT